MKITRKQFLSSLLAAPFIGLSTYGYMRYWESQNIEVTHKKANLRNSNNPIKILHLSDFHASTKVSYEYIESVIKKSLLQKPDLAFLTGDFITDWLVDEDRYISILKLLGDQIPTYACLGNHDGGRWTGKHGGYKTPERIQKCLHESNINLLFNQRSITTIRSTEIEIIGLGDLWSRDLKPKFVMNTKREVERPIFVLCHNPDAKKFTWAYDWDIMFCGHTHGGQLIIPFTNIRPFLPIRDKRFAEGLLSYKNHLIHVTRGVGNIHGMRFNCPPEISILEVS